MQSGTSKLFAWDPAHGWHYENTGFLPAPCLALHGVTSWTPLGLRALIIWGSGLSLFSGTLVSEVFPMLQFVLLPCETIHFSLRLKCSPASWSETSSCVSGSPGTQHGQSTSCPLCQQASSAPGSTGLFQAFLVRCTGPQFKVAV